MSITKRKAIRNAITVLAFLSMFMLPGCTKQENTDIISNQLDDDDQGKRDDNKSDDKEGGSTEKDIILMAAEEALDPDLISLDEVERRTDRSQDKIFTYKFKLNDPNGDYEDDISSLYKIFNDALKDEQFENKNMELLILTDHYQNGVTNVIADIMNFDDSDNYDHICNVIINGIDDMTADYEEDHRYAFNDIDYWESFVNAESISYSPYVEYQSTIDGTQAEREQLDEYLYDLYPDLIETGTPNTITNGVHIPSVDTQITVIADAVEQNDDFGSVSELMDSIRRSVNEYYEANPDDDFLNLRITAEIYLDDGSFEGYIQNYDSYTNDLLGGFNSIRYKNATVDELTVCEDVKILNLYGRPIEEVEQIIDNMDSVETVVVVVPTLIEELSYIYPRHEFR